LLAYSASLTSMVVWWPKFKSSKKIVFTTDVSRKNLVSKSTTEAP